MAREIPSAQLCIGDAVSAFKQVRWLPKIRVTPSSVQIVGPVEEMRILYPFAEAVLSLVAENEFIRVPLWEHRNQ